MVFCLHIPAPLPSSLSSLTLYLPYVHLDYSKSVYLSLTPLVTAVAVGVTQRGLRELLSASKWT